MCVHGHQVSDCISNSIRVLKTTRQTSAETISYREAASRIIESDGWRRTPNTAALGTAITTALALTLLPWARAVTALARSLPTRPTRSIGPPLSSGAAL